MNNNNDNYGYLECLTRVGHNYKLFKGTYFDNKDSIRTTHTGARALSYLRARRSFAEEKVLEKRTALKEYCIELTVQGGMCALGKTHMRSTSSLRGFASSFL